MAWLDGRFETDLRSETFGARLNFAPILLLASTSFLLLFMAACKRQVIRGEHPSELVGTWELVWGHDCRDYGLKSDTLVLHPDGTLEQHVIAKDARRWDSVGERWKYIGDNAVSFDVRRNFFTSQTYDKLIGLPEGEVLIVHFETPPVILLDPDSDCFYKKVRE